MAIVYGQLIYGLLLVFFGILFLWARSKPMAFFSMSGVILMMVIMELPFTVLGLVSFMLFVIYWNFGRVKASRLMLPLLLLLIVPLVIAAPPDELPSAVPSFVREVGKVTGQPSLSLTGTDYQPFDDGKLMAYLKVGEYPLESAACYVDVLYPNMTHFISDQLMLSAAYRHHFEGLYYYDFSVPNVTGVYPVNAFCYYNTSVIDYGVVSHARRGVTAEDGADYFLMDFVDGQYYRVKDEGACNNVYCSFNWSFSLPTGWHTSLLSDARLIMQGYLDDDKDVIMFSVFDGSSWVSWFNYSLKNTVFNRQFLLSERFENVTNLTVRARAYDWDESKLFVDYFQLKLLYNGSYVGDLRGNEELVVSRGVQTIIQAVESDKELVSGAVIISIILIALVVILFFAGQYHIAGLLLILWTLFYGQEMEIFINVFLWFMGLLMIYWGLKHGRNKNDGW